MRSLAPRLAD